MNSLANLSSVVDHDHGDPSNSWPSPEGWDRPVKTICTGALSDNVTASTRLQFHSSTAGAAATARHNHPEWESAWSDHQHQLILASQTEHLYPGNDHLDCKPSILHLDSSDDVATAGSLRQYNNGFLSSSSAAMASSTSTSWPDVLSVVRQNSTAIDSNGSNGCGAYNHYGVIPTESNSPSTQWQQLQLNGYGAHNYLLESCRNGISTPPATAEQRHYNQFLGLSSMDQHRRIHDILKGGLYSTTNNSGSTDCVNTARIGLNLGVRTYFSTEDTGNGYAVARFDRRFQPSLPTMHVPLCQAEGCKADLSIAKHYHRRHKVCEFHSKASNVVINGNTQRFCQQCSRFHGLSEFDEGKRSCRKRLADHNRRRRKPQPSPGVSNSALTPSPRDHGVATASSPTGSSKNESLTGKLHSIDKESTTKTEITSGRTSCLEPGQDQGTSSGSGSLMALAKPPSVVLTLQNHGARGETRTNGSNIINSNCSEDRQREKERSYFLKGPPSLTLSGNSSSARHGHQRTAGTVTSSQSTGRSKFEDVAELSVPWLTRAAQQSRMAAGSTLMQDQAGAASGLNVIPVQTKLEHGLSASNGSTQYMNNEHGTLLAEHIQSLNCQASNIAAVAERSYMMNGKVIPAENPWQLQQDQPELSLLDTANHDTTNGHYHHHEHISHRNHNLYNLHNHHHHQSHGLIIDGHQVNQEQNTVRASGASPLGFLQNHHHHHHQQHHNNGTGISANHFNEINTASPEAGLSLHSNMQVDVLRPGSALHNTTADFIKDGFA